MAKRMQIDSLREYARIGAQATLERLYTEIAAIESVFPDLKRQGRAPSQAPTVKRKRAARRAMTTAERKSVSERMKRYWAERRKSRKPASK